MTPTIESPIDPTASELISLRAQNARLNHEIGSLQQRLANMTTVCKGMTNGYVRQRNNLKAIETVTARCDEGEAGTCGKCAYCLARVGLWGCL